MTNYQVILTRSSADNARFASKLEAKGLQVLSAPAIEINFLEEKALGNIHLQEIAEAKYNFLIFTSKNAVKALKELLQRKNIEIPKKTKLACIAGASASALKAEFKRDPVFLSVGNNFESLYQQVLAALASDDKALLVRGRPSRIDKLHIDKRFSSLLLYENLPVVNENYKALLLENCQKLFVFFSPSAFTSSLTSFSEQVLRDAKIITIGATTSKAIESAGFKVSAQASDVSESAIEQLIQQFISQK